MAMTLSVLAASLVVALVECALDRYSYTMEWVYYLSVALSPSLLLREGFLKREERRDLAEPKEVKLAWTNS